MKAYELKNAGGGPGLRPTPLHKAGVRGPAPAWWRREFANGETVREAHGPTPARSRGVARWAALLLAATAAGTAQTRVDLKTQSKSIDFSTATATKPSKTGTSLPATCSVGETFVKTDAPAGQNLHVCTGVNVWTVQAGSVPDVSGNADKVLSTDGSTAGWRALGGDISGRPDSLTVLKLQGRAVSSAAPGDSQVLGWNAGASRWEPLSASGAVSSIFGRMGAVTAQSGDYSFPQITGTVGDSQVSAGISATKIGLGTVSNATFGYLASLTSDIQGQLNGKAASSHFHTAAGDATGDLSALTVAALQNRAIAATVPMDGQVLAWSGTRWQWEPQNPSGAVSSVFGRSGAVTAQSGDYSFSQITGAVGDGQIGTGINASKLGSGTVTNTMFGYLGSVTSDIQGQLNGKAPSGHLHTAAGDASGDLASLTVTALWSRAVSATAPANGQSLVWNTAVGQWQPQFQPGAVSSVFGRGGAVSAQPGDYSFAQIAGTIGDAQVGPGINANKVGVGTVTNTVFGYLANATSDVQGQLNGKAASGHSHTAGGDASGDIGSLTVTALQNRAVSAGAPVSGQALVWNAASSQWQPQNQTGAVPTVFGRSGNVAAQSGDYSFGQISGTVSDAQVAAGVNASKIGTGAVSNTMFGYLGNVTADIQTQLNARAGASHSHTAAGDVSGDLSSLTVTALRNRTISVATPLDGQALVWSAASSQWQPQNVAAGAGGTGGAYSSAFTSQTTVTITGTEHQLGTANVVVDCYDTSVPAMRVQPNTVSVHPTTYDVTVTFAAQQSGRCVVSSGGGGSSGGSGGASMASQLGDLNVSRTSASTLTIGANCSVATLCNVRQGSRVFTYMTSTTASLTAGSGRVYVYVDANGVLTAGHNLTLTCSSPCAAVSGVTGFPVNSIPLYTWTATSGSWDAAGGTDERAILSGKVISAGTGIATLDTGSNTVVSVDAALVPMYVSGSATLDFGPIATGTCSADLTFSMPGAIAGDTVAPGWPSGMASGLLGMMRVSAANTLAVRLCNFSGVPVDPASATYQATIVKSF